VGWGLGVLNVKAKSNFQKKNNYQHH
jgi:hypothetical protein